jgi:hypothetical protein
MRINRALATLLVRDIQVGIRAAVAAGHPAPPVELRYLDGLSRDEAKALTNWAKGIPEIATALHDRRHPQHREVAAMHDCIDHFALHHPARPDGSPEPWSEPISEPLLSLAVGYRTAIEPGEVTPTEAAAILDYSLMRGDLTAARFDKQNPQHRAVQAEIEALAERASQREPDAGAAGAPRGDGRNSDEGSGEMTETEAQTRADTLSRALQGKMTGYARAQAAEELLELHQAFPNLRPFSTAGMSADEIAEMKAARTRIVLHEMTDRARELTEGLWDGNYSGARRHAPVAELMAELGRGHGPTAPPQPTGQRADIRSQRSRDLAAAISGKIGSARREAVAALMQSLDADQAAADTAAASPAADTTGAPAA